MKTTSAILLILVGVFSIIGAVHLFGQGAEPYVEPIETVGVTWPVELRTDGGPTDWTAVESYIVHLGGAESVRLRLGADFTLNETHRSGSASAVLSITWSVDGEVVGSARHLRDSGEPEPSPTGRENFVRTRAYVGPETQGEFPIVHRRSDGEDVRVMVRFEGSIEKIKVGDVRYDFYVHESRVAVVP